jgi:hypothetical protein
MWAINKSPLIIGAALDPKRLSKASLDILSNKEIIAINQDSLAKQAQLVRRNTEDEWDGGAVRFQASHSCCELEE